MYFIFIIIKQIQVNDKKAKEVLDLLKKRSENLKTLTKEKLMEDNEDIGTRLGQKYLIYLYLILNHKEEFQQLTIK